MSARRVVVVSGLSGAGKTVVLHSLEDLGFYCVDNLPAGFLSEFLRELEVNDRPLYQQVAVVIDARNPAEGLSRLPGILEELKAKTGQAELVFIEAEEEVLLKRFSETRRRHPLSSEGMSLAGAIARERRLLEPLSECADLRIDTTRMHIHQLRELVRTRIARRPAPSLSLQLLSFGYKHGVPPEADFVFDVRCLPNPHWEASLRDRTGRDAEVAAFLDRSPFAAEMVAQIAAFLGTWVPRFEAEDRAYLTVAVGCTGGRHRSVYVVERLAERLKGWGKDVLVGHRDL